MPGIYLPPISIAASVSDHERRGTTIFDVDVIIARSLIPLNDDKTKTHMGATVRNDAVSVGWLPVVPRRVEDELHFSPVAVQSCSFLGPREVYRRDIPDEKYLLRFSAC
jgi:hypothetical protein